MIFIFIIFINKHAKPDEVGEFDEFDEFAELDGLAL